jgi:pimeloyl-ACP methyl ester carboxylesterase
MDVTSVGTPGFHRCRRREDVASDTPGTVRVVSRPRSLDLPPDTHRIDLDTTRGRFAALSAEPAGARAGSPALLVPGFTGSKEDFVAILGPLRDGGRRVVAIDLRGQYETPGSNNLSDYAIDALAADLHAVVDAIGGRVHLLGHSFGGFVARVAVTGPAAPRDVSRIDSLVLMDSGPGRVTGARSLQDLGLLAQVLGQIEPPVLWELKREVERSRGDLDAPEPINSFLRERFVRTHPRSLAAAAADLAADVDRLAPLRGASVPTLVLYGSAEDVWSPEELAAMAHEIGARDVVIEGAGHSPAVDDPDATAAALAAFWAEVDAAR